MAINNNWVSNYTSPYSLSSNKTSTNNIELEDSIVMKDSKTGRKWKIKIYDGELITEPLEKEDIRYKKIDKILEDDSNI
jgi:hypothetical protein